MVTKRSITASKLLLLLNALVLCAPLVSAVSKEYTLLELGNLFEDCENSVKMSATDQSKKQQCETYKVFTNYAAPHVQNVISDITTPAKRFPNSNPSYFCWKFQYPACSGTKTSCQCMAQWKHEYDEQCDGEMYTNAESVSVARKMDATCDIDTDEVHSSAHMILSSTRLLAVSAFIVPIYTFFLTI
jgi:hypothetical protein